jgi:hypothetical protein
VSDIPEDVILLIRRLTFTLRDDRWADESETTLHGWLRMRSHEGVPPSIVPAADEL